MARREALALRFGTSGVRGLVSDMTDRECYLYTLAFLRYVKTKSSPRAVAIAGDRRKSTPRILKAVGFAAQQEGLRVDACGLVPTPARDGVRPEARDAEHHGHRKPHTGGSQRHQVQHALGRGLEGGRGRDFPPLPGPGKRRSRAHPGRHLGFHGPGRPEAGEGMSNSARRIPPQGGTTSRGSSRSSPPVVSRA